MVQPPNKRLVTEASTVFDSRYKDTTKAPGVSNPAVVRTIADPNRTASKWRELVSTGLFQTSKPDPVHFFGWNADKAAGGGDPAEPALYMGFEADYWDTATNRTMEWYIGVVRADGSGPQFRPFAFTAARDSNTDLSANVAIDIGLNTAGGRSQFQVVQGGANPIVTVKSDSVEISAGVVFRKSQNAQSVLLQRNAANTAYVNLMLLDSIDRVLIAPDGGRVGVSGPLDMFVPGVTAGWQFRNSGASLIIQDVTHSYDMIQLLVQGVGGAANSSLLLNGNLQVAGNVGFYGTGAIAKQTGVPQTAAGIFAALVNLGLIAA